eukprot:GFUD01098661.1.p1 GENE.GFUD01098661.1~~GFUD01098661.1.p1  ORF type:complete len:144 (-),score=23.76 GFUD01098661.1:304-672(-)
MVSSYPQRDVFDKLGPIDQNVKERPGAEARPCSDCIEPVILSPGTGVGILTGPTPLPNSICPETLPCKDSNNQCCAPYMEADGQAGRCPLSCSGDWVIQNVNFTEETTENIEETTKTPVNTN